MPSDTEEFGSIVDALVGRRFERSLAVISIKLRFGTDADARGTHYIWIDPPWELYSVNQLVTTSADYNSSTFQEWSRLLDPLNSDTLESWGPGADGSVTFAFGSGFRIVLPDSEGTRERGDSWYSHWYARERTA